MAAAAAPGPIRVVMVEAGQDMPDVSARRAAGGTYDSALVFAVHSGRLVGEVEVPMHGAPVPARALDALLRRELGEHWDGRAGEPDDTPLPFVSVVIATTMERVDELRRCVDSLTRLAYRSYEVIVVDNRPDSSPGRVEVHRSLTTDPRVRVVTEARPGISAARNHGARSARAEIVAFTDDDAVVHPLWLHGIGRRFERDPEVDCVSGVVLPAELETPAQIWFERSGSKLPQRYRSVAFAGDGSWRERRLAWLRRARYEVTATPENAAEPVARHLIYRAGTFGMGANIAFRVSTLRALGWFDETLGTGTASRGAEDIAAIARLLYTGGRITMDPGAIVHHYHRPDYAGSRRQMYGYGVGLTAAFAALVRSDPRHLVGLGHMLAPGLRVLSGKSSGRKAGRYPRDLARTELRGLLVGPFAYARSLRAHRG